MTEGLKFALLYLVAFALIVVLFAYAHIGEKSPFLGVIAPVVILAVAGYFSSNVNDRVARNSTFLQWIGWSALLGLAVGLVGTFA